MERVPILCTDCFKEYLIKVIVRVELHPTDSDKEFEPLELEMFFCEECQKLITELV